MTTTHVSGALAAPHRCVFPAALAVIATFAVWLTAAIADPVPPTSTGDITLPKDVRIDSLVLPDGTVAPGTVGFGVNANGVPVVADGTQLRVLGDTQTILDIAPRKIDDFSWMLAQQLLLISGDRLISPGQKGQLRELALPMNGMKVRRASGSDAYIFGGAGETASHDLYLAKPSGKMIKLASLPTPIADASGFELDSYLATGKRLLRIAKGRPVEIFLEADADITSIAAAVAGGVYFSTSDGVSYANRRGSIFPFLPGFTGILRTDAVSLYVWNAAERRLLRIQGISSLEAVLN